jgi:hypothetical protein
LSEGFFSFSLINRQSICMYGLAYGAVARGYLKTTAHLQEGCSMKEQRSNLFASSLMPDRRGQEQQPTLTNTMINVIFTYVWMSPVLLCMYDK